MLFLISSIMNAFSGELEYDWHWRTVPNIEICPSSSIEIVDVARAISYWNDRDVYVEIESIAKVEECDMTKLNVIQITDHVDFDKNYYHAMTNVKWIYYGELTPETELIIKRVHIQLPNSILQRDDILYHEFGHALGLGHSNDAIMKNTH